jgi:hypothetical protein
MSVSVRTLQQTHYISATKSNRLIRFMEVIVVYCGNGNMDRVCVSFYELLPYSDVCRRIAKSASRRSNRHREATCLRYSSDHACGGHGNEFVFPVKSVLLLPDIKRSRSIVWKCELSTVKCHDSASVRAGKTVVVSV